MVNRKQILWLSVVLLAGAPCACVGAGDWPMWRANAQRGAASPHGLSAKLHLQWVRAYPRLEPAWNDQPRLRFDKAYRPVVMGKRMFIGSSRNDSVRALDTETGAEQWVFYADGPVRFAPVAWRGKLYVPCDDGYLYCLDAAKGTVRWRFRGGPSGRRVLGNRRLISMWPVRGAPVLLDGTVYFAAGIWPFMGVFLYALDAETGRVVWHNDGTGSRYALRPHYSPAFSGLAPQGYLAATEDDLLVPNGRTTVARLDRKTGRLIYHHAPRSGTYHLAANRRFFFNAGAMFETATNRPLPIRSTDALVLTDDTAYLTAAHHIRAHGVGTAQVRALEDRRGRVYYVVDTERKWLTALPYVVTALIQAGPRLYAAGPGAVTALDLRDDAPPEVSWTGKLDGTPVDLLAADGKLFAVTLEGRIYCFGATQVEPKRYGLRPPAPPRREKAWVTRARDLLAAAQVTEGYCVALGLGTGRLVEELARQSKLEIIAIERNAKKVTAARRHLDALGLYGTRVVVLQGDPAAFPFPPYLARLAVSEEADPSGGLAPTGEGAEHVFRMLRPYGGVACFQRAAGRESPLVAAARTLPGAEVRASGGYDWLVRKGPLPGSADWTHENADAANTVTSQDARVKAPLGLLWFGGPSNRKVLPRHGHGPQPQVAGGRLFIEGADMLRAVDVYTGRVLWEASLPDVGAAYDNTSHQPGANALGSNYVSLRDGIYVAYGRKCLRLDPATGRSLSEFGLPKARGAEEAPRWGSIRVYKDVLIAAADPISLSSAFEETSIGRSPIGLRLDASSSERIVAMNRHTGKELWQITATHGFIHNSIAAGGGRVFCIDRPRVPHGLMSADERRAGRTVAGSRLRAIDVATGRAAWSTEKDVFGAWLAYSKEHDLLLQAGRASRDMVWDEADHRMIVYRAKTGQVVWDKKILYDGPCIVRGSTIITARKAYSLLTGERITRKHPLTGRDVPWRYARNYGCGTAVGGRHLLLFRSAAAGYLDLDRNAGTGNFGGFRSGCTSNLIPANGVLNAPDYTRTCTCGYPNQCSLALVHMPGVETWTFNKDLPWDGTPIRRMGINLGAPGDRLADSGTLWLEFPYAGGPTPEIPIRMSPPLDPDADPAQAPGRFVKHPSRIQGRGLRWVAASGMKGVRRLTIPLALPTMTVEGPDGEPIVRPRALRERTYTVRLHFCEPDPVEAGRRRMNVKVQDREVLRDFDIVKKAGGPDRPAVVEYRGVKANETLTVELVPSLSSKLTETVISGVEVLAEGW